MDKRPIIYQLLPRLFTNYNEHCVPDGSLSQNGSGKMNAITGDVLHGIKELGITHVWYTGVIEHSHDADYSRFGIVPHNKYITKGKAGSPYAIVDYYDVDPDIAEDVEHRMEEFEALVERTHEAGLKVIIDFVPNHVGRQYHSDVHPQGIEDFGSGDDPEYFFKEGNDFYYITRQRFSPQFYIGEGEEAYSEFPAKASGNDCFTAFPGRNDWYETVKLNYGIDYGNNSRHFDPVPALWFKMLNILRFWASKGVDAFRCDMVFMVPIEFWEWAIPRVKAVYPSILFIAEIYDVSQYREFIFRGGFDYLYDKVNLYDTLRGVECCNVSAACLTNCWQAVDGIGDKMLNFLENHDEQRFSSDFYAGSAENVLPSLVVSSMMGKGAVMIYAGQELGERGMDAEGFSGCDGRTTIFDYWSVPTVRRWLNNGKPGKQRLTAREWLLRKMYARVLHLCNEETALRKGDFFDLMYVNYSNPGIDPHRQYAFLRHSEGNTLVIAVNFGNMAVDASINIPQHAFDVLGLEEGCFEAIELLGGTKEKKYFSPEEPFPTHLPGHGAVVWKLRTPKRKNPNNKHKTLKETINV